MPSRITSLADAAAAIRALEIRLNNDRNTNGGMTQKELAEVLVFAFDRFAQQLVQGMRAINVPTTSSVATPTEPPTTEVGAPVSGVIAIKRILLTQGNTLIPNTRYSFSLGTMYAISIQQDSVGGRSVSFPPNWKGLQDISINEDSFGITTFFLLPDSTESAILVTSPVSFDMTAALTAADTAGVDMEVIEIELQGTDFNVPSQTFVADTLYAIRLKQTETEGDTSVTGYPSEWSGVDDIKVATGANAITTLLLIATSANAAYLAAPPFSVIP